ncbi:hypothetical protein EVAR_53305_1 [Eumeta japonica]|uniref:Uncharacterized protein n=1 Tax=Eumeta variegata TaxID=151549 RepID=A0A4C1X8D7_EUMVA|nr:hypothetical protein EVAR_53305_1 [Eumeta japonica]
MHWLKIAVTMLFLRPFSLATASRPERAVIYRCESLRCILLFPLALLLPTARPSFRFDGGRLVLDECRPRVELLQKIESLDVDLPRTRLQDKRMKENKRK